MQIVKYKMQLADLVHILILSMDIKCGYLIFARDSYDAKLWSNWSNYKVNIVSLRLLCCNHNKSNDNEKMINFDYFSASRLCN